MTRSVSPWLRSPPPLVIAHRGNSSDRPENTLASFASAVEVGAPLVECDVRLTSDERAVVIHDAALDRTTTGRGPVAGQTLDQIRRHSAGYAARFGASYSDERVPTLAEVLSLLRGRAGLLIEIKKERHQGDRHTLEQRVIEEVRRAGLAHGVVLISFDARALAFCREVAPELPRGLVVQRAPAGAVREAAEALDVALVLPEKGLLSDELCEAAGGGGRRVATWVVDDPLELDALARFEPVGVGSNRPAQLLAHLRDRRKADPQGPARRP